MLVGFRDGVKVATAVEVLGDVLSLVHGTGAYVIAPSASQLLVRVPHAVYSLALGLRRIHDRRSVALTAGLGRAEIPDAELAGLFVERMLTLYQTSLVRATARLASKLEGGLAVAAAETSLSRPRRRRVVGLYASSKHVCISYGDRVAVIGAGENCYTSVLVVANARKPIRISVYELDRASRKL
jgi:hypothetical protein